MERGRDEIGYAAVESGEWTIRDEEARRYVQLATRGVESLVRSTLGPLGMEKQIRTKNLQDEPETVQTADASQILDAVERGEGFNHPVAALFVDAIDSMQTGLADGSTTAIVLTAALVDNGLDRIEEGLHPGNVVIGYAMAAARAGEVLDELAREVTVENTVRLRQVAATSMTSDLDAETRETYASRVVEAVQALSRATDGEWLDTDDVKLLSAPPGEGGFYEGLIVRRFPGPLHESERAKTEFDWSLLDPVEDATVALIDREIDFERTGATFGEGKESGVTVETLEQLETYTQELDAHLDGVAAQVASLGVDVLVSQPAVDDRIRTALDRHGVAVVDEVEYPLSDVYRLARACDATVVGDLTDLTPDRLGTVPQVTERRVGDEKWTFFEGCDGGVFTLVVDVETETARTQHERVLADALEVTALAVMDAQVLPGAGAPAMAVAQELREYAPTIPDVEQLAVEAFAEALEQVPVALAENAGADPIDALAALRVAHSTAETQPASVGLAADGTTTDAWADGIVEPRRVFSQAIETANTVAEELVTLDAVLYPNVDLETYTPRPERD
ncbi:TCP-1/cpn60 chaperonin family protein [Haladaptatus sp. DYSN1]|uniref:TCP-1/cpn60 chaperonin family protein n=1 Tax=unclassified Haladaptatus TaxID=2622732 RepID=UPI00240741B2|nr:TCP-1/cpn60 chaperonin family protein [Haladaptatus sp. DYSN1]